MGLIIQKYGGTSVGDAERIRRVAARLLATQKSGHDVVAVISAMAGVTDSLIKLAGEMAPQPSEREMDVLLATGEQCASALTAMAVNALGGKAVSLTGAAAGIVTDGVGTKAKEATPNMEDVVVRGVSLERNQAKVTICGVPDRPGCAGKIFSAISAANLSVDMIVQNASSTGKTDLSFTLHKDDFALAEK